MDTQTFQASEIKEALALVRRELGPDALILGTRQLPPKGFGLIGKGLIEVTAQAPKKKSSTEQARPAWSERTGEPPSSDAQPTATSSKHRTMLALKRASRLQSKVPPRTVRQTIVHQPDNALAAATGGTMNQVSPLATLRRRLLAALIPRDLCEQWLSELGSSGQFQLDSRESISSVQSEQAIRTLLRDKIGPPITLSSPDTRSVALVGPTGVGKTTTLAKLGAKAVLVQQKKTAFVSLDDNRIGALAQIKAIADLLEVPMLTCRSKDSLARCLAELRDYERIFIDTPGYSPTDTGGWDHLTRKLERAGEPVATHLCVRADTRQQELDRIIHLYKRTNLRSLIVTKVDEAVAIGSVLAARFQSNLPFSVLTTGQQIPEDITAAKADTLIDMLLGAQTHE